MNAVPRSPGILAYLSEPVQSFAPDNQHRLRLRPLLVVHAVASLALGMAFVLVEHEQLVASVREAAPQADAGIVAGSLIVVLLGLLPVIAVGGVLLSGVVFHAVVRVAGGTRTLNWSLTAIFGALLPVAFRNVLLAVAVLIGGGDIASRLSGIRFGDPFLLWAGALVFVAARAGGGLSRTRSCAVAALVIGLPLLAQVSFVA